MRLALFHRRLTLLMALAALTAFAAGAALPLAAVVATGSAVVVGLFYQPPEELSERIERIVLIVSAALMVWALYQVLVVTDDVVAPVVALLLVLLAGEALRSLSARNDTRLYTLSFALLVASTAYLPGLLFGVAFVAFVVIATLALMVGHLRRQAEAHGVARVGIDRPFLTATAALSLVTLAMSAFVFLAFPRLPRNLFQTGIRAPGAVMAGFADEVSLGAHGARIYPNPEVVLRVELEGRPRDEPPGAAEIASMHWRGRSYDHFDGLRWTRSRVPRSRAPRSWYRERWPPGVHVQRIYGGALDARVLFGLHPVLDVQPLSRIRPVLGQTGDLVYVGSGSPIYRATSVAARPSADSLRSAVPGPRLPPLEGPARALDQQLDWAARAFYLQLPPLPARVHALADSLTRGLETQYDRAIAVQRWLESEFSYTLELPPTAEQATLEHFLFERRAGHCEYFSTAMAVLLRAVGIPTRNVNGLLGGEWNEFGQYVAVTQNEAHSWVEVWFSGMGWVAFDPTPGGGAGGVGARDNTMSSLGYLLDGLQHRWNKWVIDYNLGKQLELFGQVGDLFSRDRGAQAEADARERPTDGPGPLLLLLGGGAIAALAIWILTRPRGPRPPEASRLYVELRKAYEKRGFGLNSPTAFTWADSLERAGAPGHREARSFVRLYLARRFGGPAAAAPDHASRLRALHRRAKDALQSSTTP